MNVHPSPLAWGLGQRGSCLLSQAANRTGGAGEFQSCWVPPCCPHCVRTGSPGHTRPPRRVFATNPAACPPHSLPQHCCCPHLLCHPGKGAARVIAAWEFPLCPLRGNPWTKAAPAAPAGHGLGWPRSKGQGKARRHEREAALCLEQLPPDGTSFLLPEARGDNKAPRSHSEALEHWKCCRGSRNPSTVSGRMVCGVRDCAGEGPPPPAPSAAACCLLSTISSYTCPGTHFALNLDPCWVLLQDRGACPGCCSH